MKYVPTRDPSSAPGEVVGRGRAVGECLGHRLDGAGRRRDEAEPPRSGRLGAAHRLDRGRQDLLAALVAQRGVGAQALVDRREVARAPELEPSSANSSLSSSNRRQARVVKVLSGSLRRRRDADHRAVHVVAAGQPRQARVLVRSSPWAAPRTSRNSRYLRMAGTTSSSRIRSWSDENPSGSSSPARRRPLRLGSASTVSIWARAELHPASTGVRPVARPWRRRSACWSKTRGISAQAVELVACRSGVSSGSIGRTAMSPDRGDT